LSHKTTVVLHYLLLHRFGLVLAEHAVLTGYVLLESVRTDIPIEAGFYSYGSLFARAFVFSITFQLFLHLRDAYEFRVHRSGLDFSLRLGQGIVLADLIIWMLYSTIPMLAVVPDSGALLIRVSVFLLLWHVCLRIYVRLLPPRSGVLILGTGPLARALATEILHNPELGLSVCGFLDEDPSLIGVSIVNPKVLGLSKDIGRIVSERPVGKIAVELQDRRGRLPIDDLLKLKTNGVSVEEATSLYERVTGKIAIENLKASWMIFNEGFEVSGWVLFLKRLLSFGVSLVLLVLFLPFLPLIALLIRLDSRGPIFYGQERVGQHGRVFTLWKLRSMRHGAERDTGPVWASSSDTRITRLGKYLRRTRIDELPQLYNVLRGEMSLVGPRPERPHFVQQLAECIPFYHLRHSVKPGVTGWAQINYRYGNTLEDAVEKLQYDLFYIKNISPLLDAIVIFDTIKTVLMRKGS
jgi:sugar transferase (PEP-CTERM system associated)